jgi:diguanylate cyclase (GGDEF)-like protein
MRRRRPVSKIDTAPSGPQPVKGAPIMVLEQPGGPSEAHGHASGSLESMFDEISFGGADARPEGSAQSRGKYDDLWQLSLSDPQTGLANRLLLLDRLTRELTRRRRHGGCVVVSHIDLANLKDINHEFGYTSGNEVLRRVSGRLTAMLRSEDTVSRISENELVAVMTVEDEQYVELLMRRVKAVLDDPIALTGGTVKVTTTLGTVTARNSESAEEVLARAGQAA